MAALTMVEAIALALSRAMENDDSVVLLGEDIGINGGVFRATNGLLEKFGEQRVIDSPLAETMIAGLAVGMSAQGMKPVIEAQFMGFIYPMVEQIICHASRMRHRTRGRLSCPMVIRAPFGGGIHAPEHHSESTESIFAHMPGVRVVIPSSPARAYGLLLAAIRDPDPVIFLEPKRIYRLNREEIQDNGDDLPLDVCYVLRDGSDITLVTWGAMIKETLETAEVLAQQGISAEVIDVATISPLDMETIVESVQKTGRCVIIHEAARMCGVGAEIAAGLADTAIFHLHAPIKRVTGYDSIMPLYKMEKQYMPSVKRILGAVTEVLEVS
jgi:pyruvate dehydrogenase E1 component beta subunit